MIPFCPQVETVKFNQTLSTLWSANINFLKFLFARVVLTISAWLPLKVVHAIATVLGWSSSKIRTHSCRITEQNLRLCFPELSDKEFNALVTASLIESTKTALEMGKTWLWDIENILSMITEVEGESVFEEANTHGKGVIFIAPHLGNFEVFGQYIADKTPSTFLYKPPKNQHLDKTLKDVRTRSKLKIAPANYKGVAQLLKALKRGEAIGILPDQVPAEESGVYAPFFGVPALTMTLVSGLVERTGAKVVCGFAERLPRAKGFKVQLLPADPKIYDTLEQNSVEALNRSVESCVVKATDQYQWEYKRFKRRPDGTRFYKT